MLHLEDNGKYTKSLQEYQGIASDASRLMVQYLSELEKIPKQKSFFGDTGVKMVRSHVAIFDTIEGLLTRSLAGSLPSVLEALQYVDERPRFPIARVWVDKQANRTLYEVSAKALGKEDPSDTRTTIHAMRQGLDSLMERKRLLKKDVPFYASLNTYLQRISAP